MSKARSGCPIGLTLDLVGDRWTLLILRDIIIRGLHRYSEFLDSNEGISTNILAERLKRLEHAGVLTKKRDPESAKQYVYSPTKKGLDLLPILIEMMRWGSMHNKRTDHTIPFLVQLNADEHRMKAQVLAKFTTPIRGKT